MDRWLEETPSEQTWAALTHIDQPLGQNGDAKMDQLEGAGSQKKE